MAAQVLDLQFRRLYEANHDAIRAFCVRRLPPEEAADAVSEVFLTAWRRMDSLPAEGDARLWLFGVARIVVRRSARTTWRQVRVVSRVAGLAPVVASDPQAKALAASEHAEIMAALDRLNPDDREILQLRLWEELPIGEIATILECSAKAASKRYQRALARVAKAVGGPARTNATSPHLATGGGETCAT